MAGEMPGSGAPGLQGKLQVWGQSRRFKKFKKIRLGSKLLLSLIYGSGFRI